jgi:hypothetical protein
MKALALVIFIAILAIAIAEEEDPILQSTGIVIFIVLFSK